MTYSHLAGYGAASVQNDKRTIQGYVKPVPVRQARAKPMSFMARMRNDMQQRDMKKQENDIVRQRKELGLRDRRYDWRNQMAQRQSALVIRTYQKDQWSSNQNQKKEYEWGPLGY
jgi:hypothetical protein